jgi:CheY-like chemotaxis protein
VTIATRRVLIVEDEFLVAMHLENLLTEMGHHVVGCAAWLDRAMKLAAQADIDFAILDINLSGEQSFPAAAQAKKYGSEAGWDIFVRDDLGPGCLIAKKLSPEVQLQMGVDASGGKKVGYMAVYTKAEANAPEGKQLSVIFDVAGQKFSGKATVQQMPGFRGGSVPVNNVDFIYNLAKKHTLTITPEGRKPIAVSLTGTDAAFKALRSCQEAQKPT